MRNVFGVDYSKLDQSGRFPFDGACFITAELNDEQVAELDTIYAEAGAQRKQLHLPQPLAWVRRICCVIGLFVVGSILGSGKGFQEGFADMPLTYGIGIAAIAVLVVLWAVENRLKVNHMKSEVYTDAQSRAAAVLNRSKEILNIPENAFAADVLGFAYKERKGELVPASQFTFLPMEMYLYADEDCFRLADNLAVYSIPREDILGIEVRNARVTMGKWNKKESFKSSRYLPYRLRRNNMGLIVMKYYYSMTICSRQGDFEILFPPYEAEEVKQLLKL